MKDKIAASLVGQQNFLQASQYGHFFARKLELPLWERRREEWKLKMANASRGDGPIGQRNVPVVVEEKKKKRERKVDELDEIFGDTTAVIKKKKSATKNEGMDEMVAEMIGAV